MGPAQKKLTHIDSKGAARMVDVGAKAVTERRAVARGLLRVSPSTLALVRDGAMLTDIRLVEKTGGKSGTYRAS